MSEYQYYEFRAVDRALTPAEQAALRKLSTRAEISAHHFSNVYNWGDFRGDPDQMMDRYFDAFLYLTNWGSRTLELRFPRRLFEPADARPFLCEQLTLRTPQDKVILSFRVEEEETEWVEGAGWLASLLPLRSELLAGDLRALYLGWLAGVGATSSEVEDEAQEPPVPPGLGALSGSLDALTGFLLLDTDLLAVAAQASPPLPSTGAAPRKALAAWLASLPTSEKDALLLRLLEGPEPLLGAELLQRFRQSHPRPKGSESPSARRTAGQLRAAVEAHRAQRKKHTEQAKARKRAQELEALASREHEAWREVETFLASRKRSDYDAGVRLLVDLRDLARRRETLAEFERRLAHLRQVHARKSSLLQRLDALGLSGR